MPGLLSSLSFTAPWLLAGLAALPLIWWLLRLTPPRPETVSFPPTSILAEIKASEKTPVRTPWWLTALRMLVAAAAIAALAGPVLKPQAQTPTVLKEPVLAVVDNGWAAASRWPARQAFADHLASLAAENGQTLILAPSSGAAAPLEPLTPAEFRQRFQSLTPQPYPGDRAALARQLEKDLASRQGGFHVAWLADGVGDEGAAALGDVLRRLSADGGIDMYGDTAGTGALALAQISAGGAGALRARVTKTEAESRSGLVTAVTARGDRLAAAPFVITGTASSAEVSLDLPLDLRNQVARLEIAGENSAGGVSLLDGRSQRRRVGLVATEGTAEAQPLLSSSYYLERAITPFAEVMKAQTANLDEATTALTNASPSVIILSDVGRVSGDVAQRLRAFVEKGGMLIRFAGPRLEQGGDALLPAPLRIGGRTLGGAMTWESPQTPAPFEQGSPFGGLTVPKDVTISRQALADPAAMLPDVQVWARLTDGTPLVTAAKRGAGAVVFFHITANPDWSNLPISGLFVDMMRKTLEMAPLQISPGAQAVAASQEASNATVNPDASLKPWRVLDGFGKLTPPGERVQAIPAARIDTTRASAVNPAGLYGHQNGLRAINAVAEKDRLAPLVIPAEGRVMGFTTAGTVALAPWLFLAALFLFLIDAAVSSLVLGGGGSLVWRKKAAAVLVFGLFLGSVHGTRASAGSSNEAQSFALQASLETHLAYVVTGNAETDKVSLAGLSGLSKVLSNRTAVEPGEPMGVDPTRDELVFFPLVYWPVLADAEPLTDAVLAKVDAYMKQGGLIIFDTKNDDADPAGLLSSGTSTPLTKLLGKLDLPPLERVPDGHVLTKSFYLLQAFPGRWDNGDPWVEARSDQGDAAKRAVKSDGVSSVIVTSNDLAAAWAQDDNGQPLFPVVPGGEDQREMSYRTGVNIVMYALTGNYKSDQVHVPAILERLGH